MSSAHFFSFAVPLGVARSGRWAVAAITTALLAACASPPVTQPAPPIRPMPRAEPARQPELAAFSARLNGSNVVPPSGLSGPVTGAHFHSPGMSGEVAPRVMMLGRTLANPAEGRAMLTPRQRADLLAGQWYVNIRTARYPDGELRGQLIERH